MFKLELSPPPPQTRHWKCNCFMLMIYNINFCLISLSSFLAVHVFIFVHRRKRTKTINSWKRKKLSFWYYYAGFCERSNFMDCIHLDLPKTINLALTKVFGFFMYFEFLCFLKILSNKLNCFSINKSIGVFFLYFTFWIFIFPQDFVQQT